MHHFFFLKQILLLSKIFELCTSSPAENRQISQRKWYLSGTGLKHPAAKVLLGGSSSSSLSESKTVCKLNLIKMCEYIAWNAEVIQSIPSHDSWFKCPKSVSSENRPRNTIIHYHPYCLRSGVKEVQCRYGATLMRLTRNNRFIEDNCN